jgi:thioredoxin
VATVELTSENFETVVGRARMALVDFGAAWCGPCRKFGPVFNRVSERHADVVFGTVDTESEQWLKNSFHIAGIPTLMVIRDNVIVYKRPGAMPEQALEDLIAEFREVDPAAVLASGGATAVPVGSARGLGTRTTGNYWPTPIPANGIWRDRRRGG